MACRPSTWCGGLFHDHIIFFLLSLYSYPNAIDWTFILRFLELCPSFPYNVTTFVHCLVHSFSISLHSLILAFLLWVSSISVTLPISWLCSCVQQGLKCFLIALHTLLHLFPNDGIQLMTTIGTGLLVTKWSNHMVIKWLSLPQLTLFAGSWLGKSQITTVCNCHKCELVVKGTNCDHVTIWVVQWL